MKRAVKETEKPSVKTAAKEAAAAVEKNETVKTVAKAAGRTAKAAEKTVKEAAKKVEEVTTEAKKTVAKAAEKKAVDFQGRSYEAGKRHLDKADEKESGRHEDCNPLSEAGRK